MTWKEEIRKKDKQPDKMKFIGTINNPQPAVQKSVSFSQNRFDRILDKGNKRRNGLRMHELEELLKLAQKVVDAAPMQLAWIKSELKKQE